MAKRVEKVLSCQGHLDIKDPQVELHLLRSCLGLCKINHILRTVPSHRIHQELYKFDIGLRHSLEQISHSFISDCSWRQATLPTRLGGLTVLVFVKHFLHQMLLSLEAATLLVSLLVNCLPIHPLYLLGQKLLSLLVIMLSQVSLFLEKFNVETGCNLSFLPTVHVV